MTGLDFSPGLLATARECGAAAGVDVEWIEGDAQALPFEDHSFDRVISSIGHMFAPDSWRTADEMRRVCRPSGHASRSPVGRRMAASARCSAASAGSRPRRRRASSRRCCGVPRSTCVSCSATASTFERHQVECE